MKGKQNLGIAYEIPSLNPAFPALKIRRSANAWWTKGHALDLLLTAFKLGSPVKEACGLAGITARQYKYFAQLHPEIAEFRVMHEASHLLRARMTVIKSLSDPKFAFKYLIKKKRDEFGTTREVSNKTVQAVTGIEVSIVDRQRCGCPCTCKD